MPYSDRTCSDPYLSLSWEVKEGGAANLDEGNGVPVEFEVTVG